MHCGGADARIDGTTVIIENIGGADGSIGASVALPARGRMATRFVSASTPRSC